MPLEPEHPPANEEIIKSGVGAAGTPPPPLTFGQRLENLEKARRRSRLYAEMRSGLHDLWVAWIEGLLDPSSDYARVPVRTYLLCLPYVGTGKQQRWMREANIGYRRRIGQLSQRQVDGIAPKIEAALERAGLLPDAE